MSHHRPASTLHFLSLFYTLAILNAGTRYSHFLPQIGSCTAMESNMWHRNALHRDSFNAGKSLEDSSEDGDKLVSLFPENLDLAPDDFTSLPGSSSDGGRQASVTNPATYDINNRIADVTNSNFKYERKLRKVGLQSLWDSHVNLRPRNIGYSNGIDAFQLQAQEILAGVLKSITQWSEVAPHPAIQVDIILQGLKTCLSELHRFQGDDTSWRTPYERWVFNALLYLFGNDVHCRERIEFFLKDDRIMYHTAIHITNAIEPMAFMGGPEFQESWKETLRTHTKLGHLRPFLERFDKDAWSHLLCYFITHHYTRNQLHQNRPNQKTLQSILQHFGSLRYGKPSGTPTQQLIDQNYPMIMNIIQVFDNPIVTEPQRIQTDVNCYLATYHLLDFVLEHANPGTIRYIQNANSLTKEMMLKYFHTKRMLKLAEKIRDHYYNIKSVWKIDGVLVNSKCLTSKFYARLKSIETTHKELSSEVSGGRSTLQEKWINENTSDNELEAWLKSDIISYILAVLEIQINDRKNEFINFRTYTIDRLTRAGISIKGLFELPGQFGAHNTQHTTQTMVSSRTPVRRLAHNTQRTTKTMSLSGNTRRFVSHNP